MNTWETFKRERFARGVEAGVEIGREEERARAIREIRERLARREASERGERDDWLDEILSELSENGDGGKRRPAKLKARRGGFGATGTEWIRRIPVAAAPPRRSPGKSRPPKSAQRRPTVSGTVALKPPFRNFQPTALGLEKLAKAHIPQALGRSEGASHRSLLSLLS